MPFTVPPFQSKTYSLKKICHILFRQEVEILINKNYTQKQVFSTFAFRKRAVRPQLLAVLEAASTALACIYLSTFHDIKRVQNPDAAKC